MLRASAACEKAGIPTSSLVSEGFTSQARATSVGLGLPDLQTALISGHPGVQSLEELRRNIREVTADRVIANLTQVSAVTGPGAEPGVGEIVFAGTLAEVHEHFLQQGWSDGLPFIPPTRAMVEQFLRHTPRDRREVLGVMLPDNRAATIWSVAVNGVMAGCRPEYMPLLIALVEAMADPAYGVEHSGNTPGSETLIIVNGPAAARLGFNALQGVMRDGFQANTAVGRFWRLILRNVAGFLPHQTDKATFGNTWRVAIAENEETLARIDWPSVAADMGYQKEENVATVARFTGGNVVSSLSGSTPDEMLPYLAHVIVGQISWHLTFTLGIGYGTLRVLVLITPIIAETIAKAGWSKADLQRRLFETARLPAHQLERILRDWTDKPVWNLSEEVAAGRMPAIYALSDDPQRLVPALWAPEHFMIAVTGDPLRTNAYVFTSNGQLGFPVARPFIMA